MPFYQLFTDVPENNVDEFLRSLRSLSIEFRKDKGCLSYNTYRDLEDFRSFILIGEFASHDSMATHF